MSANAWFGPGYTHSTFQDVRLTANARKTARQAHPQYVAAFIGPRTHQTWLLRSFLVLSTAPPLKNTFHALVGVSAIVADDQ